MSFQRNRRWLENLNRPNANATFVEGHRHIKRRCVRHEKPNCRKVGHFGVVCRSTKSVDAISKHPDLEVAFLGEVTKNDDPWTSTVAMEATGTHCRAEVCFKLDTGADVTVISQSDYRRAGSPSLDASTKSLVGANDNVLQAHGTFNGSLAVAGWSGRR